MICRILLVTAALCCSCLAGAPAEEQKFELIRTRLEMAESPPTDAFTLQTDAVRLAFIPPREAIVGLDREKREVRLSFQDERCLITIRFSDLKPAMASPASWEKLQVIMQARYPGADVSAGAACFGSVGPAGCSFTVLRKTEYKTRLVTRVSFLPYKDGMIEVTMTSADVKFLSQQFALNSFLNCLRIEKRPLSSPRLAATKSSH